MANGPTVLTERIPTEHEEQRELVKWFRQTFDGVRIFAIPNGGARSITTAARLKRRKSITAIRLKRKSTTWKKMPLKKILKN
jgi:hypothetical protein